MEIKPTSVVLLGVWVPRISSVASLPCSGSCQTSRRMCRSLVGSAVSSKPTIVKEIENKLIVDEKYSSRHEPFVSSLGLVIQSWTTLRKFGHSPKNLKTHFIINFKTLFLQLDGNITFMLSTGFLGRILHILIAKQNNLGITFLQHTVKQIYLSMIPSYQLPNP